MQQTGIYVKPALSMHLILSATRKILQTEPIQNVCQVRIEMTGYTAVETLSWHAINNTLRAIFHVTCQSNETIPTKQ